MDPRDVMPGVPGGESRALETRAARTTPREPRSFRPWRSIRIATCLLAIPALLAFAFYPKSAGPVPREVHESDAVEASLPWEAGRARIPPPVVAREEPKARKKEWSAPDLASDGYAVFLVTELGLSPREAAAEVTENRRLLATR